MAQNSGGKNFWGLMQSIVVDSGLAAAAGEAVATRMPAGARSHLAAAGEAVARSVRRSALEVVPPSELGLVLLASRLTDLAYCATTPEAIAAGVSTLLAQSSIVWFKPQDPRSAAHDAQWYLARGTLPPGVDGPGGPALFLVFRGTQSGVDVMNDVMARPKAAASGGMFHEGFLRAVADDAELHAQLAAHAVGSVPLYLMGHSLGGSLALTLWGAGLLPAAHTGRATVVALGAPAVHHGEVRLSAAQRRARVILLVNGADVVPRLLGSPLSTSKAILSRFLGERVGSSRALLESLERYCHPPQLELLYLTVGQAQRVPYEARMDVLHLRESLATSAVRDHSTYAQALEGLMGASAWRASAVPPPPPPPPPPGGAVPAVVVGVPVQGGSGEEAAVPMGLPVLPDPGAMRVGAIKAELEARGVPTAALLEKAELVEALRQARRRA